MAFVNIGFGLSSGSISTQKSTSKTCPVRMAWTGAGSASALDSAEGSKLVVSIAGQKVLLKKLDGQVYAVSNKCSHLGLPLEGKILKASYDDSCVTCAAHGTSFDIKTGEVKGDWCPKLPSFLANIKKPAPLPTFPCRVVDGAIEVDI
mmetsp:Transcript_5521/g.9725  ORF Transcript_5521/g.9725 Transcript_5521/m.9725 type:complete len:148 (-) Transcript_5521:137-580(-)